MTDYIAIMLNGLFTGLGIITANEIYRLIKKYRDKVNNKIDEIDKKLRVNNEKHKQKKHYDV